MAKFTIKRKGDFLFALCFFIGSCLLNSYPDPSFPKESELKYYSGKLDILKVVQGDHNSKSTDKYIAFYDKKTKTIYEFSCSYSMFGSSSDSCGSDADFAPYAGKVVTVGWYKQDKRLGFSNKRLQMVTLRTEDKVIRSYEDTAAILERDKKSSRNFLFFISLVSICIYWIFGKNNNNQ